MTSPIKQKADGHSQTPFLTMKNFSATPSDCPPIWALTPIPMKHPRETTCDLFDRVIVSQGTIGQLTPYQLETTWIDGTIR